MQHRHFRTYPILRPAGWLYGRIMALRNRWFDNGRLRPTSFNVPVISVGNISAGGTGKTPMCAYLLQSLCRGGHSPALLSRGYGRRTKGFRAVTPAATAATVGDEPLELYRLYNGSVPVYVCEDRCKGAQLITAANNSVDVLVLDDAYQHRYIDRDLNILLTDYHRLYIHDKVMPEGLLREEPKGAERADVVVVTKCPPGLTERQANAIAEELRLSPRQRLFFTTVRYSAAADFTIRSSLATKSAEELKSTDVLVFTGIAEPSPLIEHYTRLCRSVRTLHFSDHHVFTPGDIRRIAENAKNAEMIITTAKDLQRLPNDLPQEIRQKLFVQRISIEFLLGQQKEFDDSVRKALTRKSHHSNTYATY